MSLTAGTRLGPYKILAPIGSGGMGQVYRARDTRLNRDVALKILPDSLANDSDRLARLTREAQTLASLNHPHIAQIYGLEESGGVRALVMELVEGEDLSQRIARGAIPIDEALPIAKQIAEALEAAHEQSVIHRDLKPANIKLRGDGTVKVLDFGLAKAMEPAGAMSASASMSPTITTPAMTQAGMILGTAAYMSPEQASGKPVDKRADVWSFGVVLWEMLTGRRLFDGETVSHTLADVLRGPIEFSQLPAATPKPIRDLLRRCLNRDVKKRLRDIGEARLQLEEALSGAGEDAASSALPAVAPVVSRTRDRLAWTLAPPLAVLTLAALGLAAFAYFGRPPADMRPMRFFVSPPDGWSLTLDAGLTAATGATPGPLTVSPDGRRIAFLANTMTGRSRLWVRALDTLTAQELPGTDGASRPFWSPDSGSLGFYSEGKLKTIAISGGPPVTVCDSPDYRGGTWNRDGVIVFSSGVTSALQKVAASGGVPTAATVLGQGETGHGLPTFLPDGRHFFHWAYGVNSIYVASLDSTDRTLLLKNPGSVNVLYTEGHLLFLRETTLMAQPFDLGRLILTGEPVPIAEQIQILGTGTLNGVFSASDTGVLVYQTGISTAGSSQLTWFDRTGKLVGTVEKLGRYNTVALSPDGTRVAVSRIDPQDSGSGGSQAGNPELWVHEFAREGTRRLTFDPARDWMGAWSPDGTRIAWGSTRDGNDNLYQKLSNGAGNDEPLLTSSDVKYAYDWSHDGRFLLYAVVVGAKYDLWVLPLVGDDRKPTRYLETDFNEFQARFSPDSRYIAYSSNESGRSEVYVRPFPTAAGGKWMVSQGGGNQPRWRRDGKELFYISADSKVMAVEVATTPAFTHRVPKALFAAPIFLSATAVATTHYDVTADGQKFLINALPTETTAAPPTPMTVVLNWTAGLQP